MNMSYAKMSLTLLFLLVALISQASACGKRGSDDDKPSTSSCSDSSSSGTTVNACCVCGQPMNLSLVVSNQLQEPFFELRTEVTGVPQRELLHQLEKAADKNVTFRFTSQYYGSLGYMITEFNGLAASTENKTYWRISGRPFGANSFESLQLGVSSYIPTHNEVVMFSFTSYASGNH